MFISSKQTGTTFFCHYSQLLAACIRLADTSKSGFMMHRLITILLFLTTSLFSYAQSDEVVIRKIYNEALTNGRSYDVLAYLSNQIGGRLAGSPQAAAAVEYTRQVMLDFGFDTVFLQPVMVPRWVRGKVEKGRIVNSKKIGSVKVNICALGNSIGTGIGGISAQIIEVQNFEELVSLGESEVKGKIVFYNRPLDPTLINTFRAYGGAVNQRGGGPVQAAKLGAVGVVVRSMTLSKDDVPHTGATHYQDGVPEIPAVAISTNDADLLSSLLKDDPGLSFYFETHCKMMPDVLSYNVVGEITGSKNPDEYIVVGGHLDSWDNGDGAHDDGAGCVQAIEVLRIFKALGMTPVHSIRAVMFMNEENGLRGGTRYAELAEKNNEKHIAGIESDRGGFTPRGFTIDAEGETLDKIMSWKSLFTPYNADDFLKGGGGADIGPLRSQGSVLIGLYPDSQRYFDYHHSAIDTFDKVNKRELEMGAAAMAALVYLIDHYGL